MLSRLQGGKSGKGVGVLGGGNDHCIDVVDLLVKITEVHVGAGPFAPRETGCTVEVFLVYVAQGNHLLVSASRHVTAASSPYPDEADCQLAVGRLGLSNRREAQCRSGQTCELNKFTSGMRIK